MSQVFFWHQVKKIRVTNSNIYDASELMFCLMINEILQH